MSDLFVPSYWWACHCGYWLETEDLTAPLCKECGRRMFRTASWAPWNRSKTS